MMPEPSTLLLSIDFENILDRVPQPERYEDRLTININRWIGFLDRHELRCTVFVLGNMTERYGDAIKRLADSGHEIASHGHGHEKLMDMEPDSLRRDLERSLEGIEALGLPRPVGYRAPFFSLTEKTCWAWEVLSEMGFLYSSSVLPTANPHFGWAGFDANTVNSCGLLEIPLSLSHSFPNVPYAGGVYFRALPEYLVMRWFRRDHNRGLSLASYFHPYDVDDEQVRFRLPELDGSRLKHWFFYRGRGQVFPRLERVLDLGWSIGTYRERLTVSASSK